MRKYNWYTGAIKNEFTPLLVLITVGATAAGTWYGEKKKDEKKRKEKSSRS